MSTELPSKFDAAAIETLVSQTWLDEKCFAADPSAPGEPYCIVIPPPNVTGALHLGHAINNTLQDILIRNHRMRGFNTLWVPGVDHAGIATQAVVEKQLKEKESKTRHDVGRDALVERIWQWKHEYGDRIVSQLKRMGCSCDWDRLRFTLDDMCAKAVRETFFKLFKDGKVFRGKRLVNWDTHLQTSISDDELYTETVKTSLWSIRYPLATDVPTRNTESTESTESTERSKTNSSSPLSPSSSVLSVSSVNSVLNRGEPTHITIATTRPETMLADTAVAYHSSNPYAAFLKGKYIRLPLTNRLIPLIEDDILVDPEFGTGYVKVTPAHDPNDYAVYTRHKGTPTEIAILNMMTSDGKVNDADESWRAYTGLKLETAARKKILEDLVAGGFHNSETDVRPHEANVNFSDRSKTAIQPYLSDQWFVKMADLAEPALEAVRSGKIQFHPERHSQQYLAWLGEKRDWPISRQLWWGHRIPVWTYRFESDKVLVRRVAGKIQTSMVRTDNDERAIQARLEVQRTGSESFAFAGFDPNQEPGTIADQPGDGFMFVCLSSDKTNLVETLEAAGFTQDPDVLDTWFSSGLWPHSTLGWPDATPELAKWYPGNVLLTGRDIITLWVARMVMLGIYNMGESALGSSRSTGILPVSSASQTHGQDARATQVRAQARALGLPFTDVAINPTILDGKGERMSKSKGNGVDPVEIIEAYGADALRFTLTTMATETQDVRMPVKKDAQGRNTSEKFDLGRNFATKVWNACRFALTNLASIPPEPGDESKWSLADRWILSRFNATLAEADAAIASYRFDAYAKTCYTFFWDEFCGWYIEAIKPAMRDPARAGQTANILAALIDGTLRLLHPVIPFVTEAVWWTLNDTRKERGLPGWLECRPADRLVLASWPKIGNRDETALHLFPRIQEVIGAIRNIRSEYKVEPKKTVTVSLAPPGEDAAQAVLANRELIELLAGCTLNQVKPGLAAPANSAKATIGGIGGSCDLYVENLIDPNAEATRIAKRREELAKEISVLEGRLASPAYTEKAPPKLVEQTRQQLAGKQAEFAKLA